MHFNDDCFIIQPQLKRLEKSAKEIPAKKLFLEPSKIDLKCKDHLRNPTFAKGSSGRRCMKC